MAFLERQLAIEQLLQRLCRKSTTLLGHISGDARAKARSAHSQGGEPGYAERGEHSKVNCRVPKVVRRICRDRSRTSVSHVRRGSVPRPGFFLHRGFANIRVFFGGFVAAPDVVASAAPYSYYAYRCYPYYPPYQVYWTPP